MKELNLTNIKKIITDIMDDKINPLKEEYRSGNSVFSLPIKREIEKLETIKDELCVAFADEFSLK